MRSMGEDAEVLRLGLMMGLHRPEDVIAWADGVIAAMDSPPIEIIEIALASGQPGEELSRLLRRVTGPADLAEAAPRVLGLLRARASEDMPLESVIDSVCAYSKQAAVSEAERGAAAKLGAMYDDLMYWGTPEDMAEEVRGFLDRHATDSGNAGAS